MYKYHNENLQYLQKAIKLVQLDLRNYISKNEDTNTEIYTRLLSFLVTNWTEVRLLKLLYEDNAFSSEDIDKVLSVHGLNDKWLKTLDIAICRAYKIKFSNGPGIIEKRLKTTPRFRYKALRDVISKDLNKSIVVRNKIAHGQWVYAFNSKLETISDKLTYEIRDENIVKLQLSMKLFKSLADLIHDLIMSPPTFEKDFDKHFQKIEQQKENFHNRDYEDYKINMQKKYKRGQEKKLRNLSDKNFF